MNNKKRARLISGLLTLIFLLNFPLLSGNIGVAFGSTSETKPVPAANVTAQRSVAATTTPPAAVPPVNIATVKAAPIAKQVYSGKSKYPSVTLTDSGRVLVKGTDYKISYINNKNPGTATIKVEGIGDYYGTKKIKFKIIIKAPQNIKIKKDQKKITISWGKVPAVTGYKVYIASNSKFTKKKKIKTVKANKKLNYSIKTPVVKRTFYIKVRAYKTINGKNYYSKTSKVKKLTTKNLKWIKVSLSKQKIYLKKGKKTIRKYVVSTGKKKTPTIKGTFYIYKKNPKHDMIGKWDPKKKAPEYIQKDVLWTTYFHGSYAFHAAYWHNNFGQPMSHGCVNMKTGQAKYLYKWAPIGTRVVIKK